MKRTIAVAVLVAAVADAGLLAQAPTAPPGGQKTQQQSQQTQQATQQEMDNFKKGKRCARSAITE